MLLAYGLSLHHLSACTVRRRMACLRGWFGYLRETGQIPADPSRHIPMPRLPQPVPRAVSADHIVRLLRAATGPRERCMMMLMVAAGLRRGEVCQVRLTDLDMAAGWLVVRGKGAKERSVPLSERVAAAITEWMKTRALTDSEFLFPSRQGGCVCGEVVSHITRIAAGRAGLDRHEVTPHSLRHTFATQLARAGTDIRTIQLLLGHSSMDTTARYIESADAVKQRAVSRLNGLLEG